MTIYTEKWSQQEKQTIETDPETIQWRRSNYLSQEEKTSKTTKKKHKNKVDLPLPEKSKNSEAPVIRESREQHRIENRVISWKSLKREIASQVLHPEK